MKFSYRYGSKITSVIANFSTNSKKVSYLTGLGRASKSDKGLIFLGNFVHCASINGNKSWSMTATVPLSVETIAS